MRGRIIGGYLPAQKRLTFIAEMSIFKRLSIGYGAMMVLVLCMGVYSTLKLNQINRISRSIDQVDDAVIRRAQQISEILYSQVGFGKKFLVTSDRDFYLQFGEKEQAAREGFKRIAELTKNPDNHNILAEARLLYGRFCAMFEEEIRQPRGEQGFAGRLNVFEWDETADRLNRKLREIIRISRLERDEKANLSSQISTRVLRAAGIDAALIVLAGILLSFLNTRSINRPIKLLQDKTKEIAKGKFGAIDNITSPPEIKELADHFNAMCRRLQELEEMKVDFISHVSHELRTPLTAIKEASNMLLEGVYAGSPEKEHELLSITCEECERLIDSVNRILDLSRMEAKMMTFHFRPCRMAPLVSQTVRKIEPIARKKNIRIRLVVSRELPPVRVDEGRIRQVLENLLANALKFSDEAGIVTIAAGLKQAQQNKFVLVAVADTGPGIPGNSLEKIFDKFQRIENGIETVRGSGLGLSIAKHIISSHGGRIWVKSREGKGSTFYFTLPVSLPYSR